MAFETPDRSDTAGQPLIYYIVVQLPAYRLSDERFAVESAFGVHLRLLRKLAGPGFDELVLISPSMPSAPSPEALQNLDIIDLTETGIRFLPAFPVNLSRKEFLLHRLGSTWRWLRALFKEPCVVHSGISSELARPLMFMASLAARSRGRAVMFIVDMDFREHALRLYQTGHWSRRSYLVNRYGYDLLMRLQLSIAPLLFRVCFYKGERLARDYGRGRTNVISFFDTVHSDADILGPLALRQRIEWLKKKEEPFRAIYFGRLAFNKGVDKMVAAVAIARSRGHDIQLRIVGSGECRPKIQQQILQLGLGDHVELLDAVPYGARLFELLAQCQVSLAAPIMEDTPRSAFDSLSRGLPIVAFDIDYFSELASKSGAVLTTAWSSEAALAEGIISLEQNRDRLAQMCEKGIAFAAANTQDIWVGRRLAWLREKAQ